MLWCGASPGGLSKITHTSLSIRRPDRGIGSKKAGENTFPALDPW